MKASFLQHLGEWHAQRKTRYICHLIERMNDRGAYNPLVGWKTKSERAYRDADRMHDADALPILRRIIHENLLPEKEETREAAYYLMSRLLMRVTNETYIAFYIDRIAQEPNKVLRFRMLVHLGRVQIPETQSMDSIISMCEAQDEPLRQAAIFALGSQHSQRCREVLCSIAVLEDQKTHIESIMAAQSALAKIGTFAEIQTLERNLHSKSREIRENAAGAIEQITQRHRDVSCPAHKV